MNKQSIVTKKEIEQIIKAFNPAGPSNMFFENIRRTKGFNVKDETVKKICHILCKKANIECKRAYYKSRNAACVKMDENWNTFETFLKDFEIEVEYVDPTKSRKRPNKYRCKLLGEWYELKSTGSFGKIFSTRTSPSGEADDPGFNEFLEEGTWNLGV